MFVTFISLTEIGRSAVVVVASSSVSSLFVQSCSGHCFYECFGSAPPYRRRQLRRGASCAGCTDRPWRGFDAPLFFGVSLLLLVSKPLNLFQAAGQKRTSRRQLYHVFV